MYAVLALHLACLASKINSMLASHVLVDIYSRIIAAFQPNARYIVYLAHLNKIVCSVYQDLLLLMEIVCLV
jgi:hypothetical protein